MTTMFRHLGLDKVAKSCGLAWGLLKEKMVQFSRTDLLFPTLGTCLVHAQCVSFRSPAASIWEKNLEGYIPVIP